MIAQTTAVGLLAGLHAASWGAYKDTPFEGFSPASFVRSAVLGLVLALGLGVLLVPAHAPLVLLVGVVYGLERLATEWWKAFLREDDQSAYSIPMRFAVRGRVVHGRAPRYLGAALVLLGVPLGCWLLGVAQAAAPGVPLWLVAPTAGALGGWATAVGGAWKDAPVEGFSGWKFLRSPVVATAWALLLSLVTDDWALLALGAAGLAVASIETYKTFLTGGRPPGKFDGRPVRHCAPRLRRTLAWAHAGLWAVLAAASLHVVLVSATALLATAVVGLAALRPAGPAVTAGLGRPPQRPEDPRPAVDAPVRS